MSDEVKVTVLPGCDFCDRTARYDGKTIMGPWANMCQKHWDKHGVGRLGTGYGQRLLLRKKK